MLGAMARTALRACRRQTLASILGAMAQITLARHAFEVFSRVARLFVGFSNRRTTVKEGWWYA